MPTSDEGVRIGFRIEFRERLDSGDPGKLAWGAYIEDTHLVAAIPRVGELVASGAIHGYHPRPLDGRIPLPIFLRVMQVEHYPAQLGAPNGSPSGGPGIMVVLHAEAPKGMEAQRDAKRLLTQRGWVVDLELQTET